MSIDTPILFDGDMIVSWLINSLIGGFALCIICLMISFIARGGRKN